MQFAGAQIVPFWEHDDRCQYRAVVRFEDAQRGPVSYDFVTDDGAEAGRWTAVAIHHVLRGYDPPVEPRRLSA